jgi:hypothetical protein
MKKVIRPTHIWFVILAILLVTLISALDGGGTAVLANPLSWSQSQLSEDHQQFPLEKMLNSNGSLNLTTGYNGALDATGWQIKLGENGEPLFEPAEQALSNELQSDMNATLWDDRFHPPGLSIGGCQYGGYCHASANAILVIGTDVYVGGDFTHAGPTQVNYIAKWDGSSWSPLGEGVNGVVRTIAADGNDLYVGGNFTQAGGIQANYIAKWNGSSWSSLGSGLNDQIYDIEVVPGGLYAAGVFTEAGGNSANHVAAWNGTSWTALGDGTNNTVRDMVIVGDMLFAGGLFTTADGAAANYIAQWNGQDWQPVGSGGPTGPVLALAVSGSNLYASVDLYSATGGSNIALWDGADWSTFATIEQGTVYDLLAKESELYAVGNFSSLEGQPILNFAHWNGSSWSWAGNIGPQLHTIVEADGDYYLGGILLHGIDDDADDWIAGIVRWDGANWHALDDGTGGGLHAVGQPGAIGSALAVDGSHVYVGGDFMRAGATAVDKVAQWNGNAWSSLGMGLEDVSYDLGKINAIAIFNQEVYVGGNFTSIGGVSANSLAKWNGNQWSNVAGGVLISGGDAGVVNDLIVVGNELYVGGWFVSIGGVPANSIAKWNGSQWVALDQGLSTGFAYKLLKDDDTLYLGGFLILDGSSNPIYVAQFNGTIWQAMGDGLNDEVYALTMHNGELIAGGRFSMSGTTPINRVARWDGQDWHPLGNGLGGNPNEKVLDLESHGELFAAGSFTTTGSEASAGLATWNGSQWETFTAAVANPTAAPVIVNDIAFQGNTLFVTGSFLEFGGQPAFNFARWGADEATYLPLIIR